MNEKHNVTQILQNAERGDPTTAEALLPLVYGELRRLAAEQLASEQPGQTLQATALVHEAWLRLVDVNYVQNWSSRRHFFGAAAEAMRRILVDQARCRKRNKHGGDFRQITIPLEEVSVAKEDGLLEILDDALGRFEQVDAVACQLVKLRYFVGLSLADAAQALELPSRTADRIWAYAKAWLLREIQRELTDSW